MSYKYPTGELVYVAHSNTAIYPPLLYPSSSAAVYLASLLRLPVLWWLYVARVATTLLGIAITWWGIRNSDDAAPVLLLFATIPSFLFSISTISADGLLLPMMIAFASSLVSISKADDRSSNYSMTMVSTLFVTAGKIAYLPLSILGPSVVLITQRRWTSTAGRLLFVVSLSVVAWLAWSWMIYDKVFSIRKGTSVNPGYQLRFLLAEPIRSVLFFSEQIISQLPKLIIEAGGKWLGWADIWLPRFFSPIELLVIMIATIFSPIRTARPRSIILLAVALSIVCFLAIFILIYLQYNAVSAPEIEGVQGRYFVPLGIVVCAVINRWKVPTALSGGMHFMVYGWTGISCLSTLFVVFSRFWGPVGY